MKIAKFAVTPELLVDALCLPTGARILGASWDVINHRAVFLIEHGNLAEQPEGAVGECEPRFHREASGDVQFDGWGQ